MTIDIAAMAGQVAAGMLETLRNSGARVKTLAEGEAQQLASAIARIGEMLAEKQIDTGEAAALLRVQRDASETVLASLAEMSRVVATQAVSKGLANAASSATGAVAQLLGAL